MDDCVHLLAVQHVCELRCRKAIVEQNDVGTQLSQRHRGFNEPTVISTQDPDAIALDDTGRCKTVGESIAARLDIREGEAPCLIDDRGAFRMQRRRRGVATWNRETPLMERQGGGQYPIRARWAQHSRAGEHLERTQLLKAEGDRMGTRGASCPTLLATF